MDRKQQLKDLIHLNQQASEQARNKINQFQRELEGIERLENRTPNKKLLQLQKRLREDPTNVQLRIEVTEYAIKANQGIFAVWRGELNEDKDCVLEISQPLFVSENRLQESPVISQQFKAVFVDNLEDLMQVLVWQPTGLVSLPRQAFYPFRENVDDSENSKWRVQYDSDSSKRTLLARIHQPLYDTTLVSKTGTAQLNFFQIPLGGSCLSFGRPKTQAETNMDQAGSLPYPKQFRITGISIFPEAGTPSEDCIKLMAKSWIRLFIGCQDYLILPTSASAIGTITKNPMISFNLSNPCLPIYTLPTPIDLIPQQNFRVELNFPVPQEFSNNFAVKAVLHGGFLYQAD